MDRRRFIKTGAAAIVATTLQPASLFASHTAGKKQSTSSGGTNTDTSSGESLKIRFLGTGAADWTAASHNGEHRNFSSILVDRHILVDYTRMAAPMLPSGAQAETAFYTHSHRDHFNAEDAVNLGLKKIYVSMSWYDHALDKIRTAASELGKAAPQVIGIGTLTPIVESGITFTALPANHGTSLPGEQSVIYLMEKGDARVLYATDTGGIPAVGAQYAGFDNHVKNKKALTGLIMEATMGIGYDDDFRIFTHSSVGTVYRTAMALKKTDLYKPKNNMPVFITHLARTLHPSQAELDRTLPEGLSAAYDGLELEF